MGGFIHQPVFALEMDSLQVQPKHLEYKLEQYLLHVPHGTYLKGELGCLVSSFYFEEKHVLAPNAICCQATNKPLHGTLVQDLLLQSVFTRLEEETIRSEKHNFWI